MLNLGEPLATKRCEYIINLLELVSLSERIEMLSAFYRHIQHNKSHELLLEKYAQSLLESWLSFFMTITLANKASVHTG